MVRTYVRKSNQKEWSVDDLSVAVSCVRDGKESINAAATQFGIPRGTLQRHLKGNVKSPGALGRFRAVFDDSMETELAEHCVEMQKRFYGLSLKDCRRLAYDFATHNDLRHPFSI